MAPRILIIEDDHATQALLEAVLRHEDMPCDHAYDGAVAIAKIARQTYDALLLDLLLPVTNDFEVLRHLKNSRPDMLSRTIIITAAADSSWRGCAEIPLACCLMRKPLDIADLVQHIRTCVTNTTRGQP